MLSILHTADVHLDRAFSGLAMTGGIAQARRQELRDAFRRFIDLALELRVDAVTIGGDLYEHERSTADTGHFLRGQFERLGDVPVLIAPGNHDPFLPDSLYHRIGWPANVTVFAEPAFRPERLSGGVTVWGAGHNAPDLREDLLAGFRVPEDGQHVLLFHGSDTTSVPEGKPVHCPFRHEDIVRTGAAFVLLGHYHGARLHPESAPVFAYPGSPEPLDFAEAGQHYVLRLDVDGGQVTPRLLPFGSVRYAVHAVDVSPARSSEEVKAEIQMLGDPGVITRIVLRGRVQPEVDLDTSALYNACAEHFRFLDIVDRAEAPYDFEGIAEESTTRGAFVRIMQERIAQAPTDERETALMALQAGLRAFERREVIV
jgi:DNA repair exonuclease SbcCD nuclease subunit